VDLEEKMKRLLMVLTAGLLVAAFALPAFAWEFELTGEYEYRLRYLSRTGDTDLFGVKPLQEGVVLSNSGQQLFAGPTNVGFAGPNWYNTNFGPNGLNTVGVTGARNVEDALNPAVVGLVEGPGSPILRPVGAVTGHFVDFNSGAHIVKGGYSTWGCDALYNDSRLTLNPVIRVNPAIRVFGVYTVGGIRHKYFQNYIGAWGLGIGTPPLERYYMSQTSENAYDTASLGSWEQFRATIQMPIGLLSIGVKDFPFGTGATFGYNVREDTLLLVAPYGPFRFLYGIWLAHGHELVGRNSWFTAPDRDTKPTWFHGGIFTYDCGALSLGGLVIWRNFHAGNQVSNFPNFGLQAPVITPGPGTLKGQDEVDLIYQAFLKYNNGRFFAAAEYAWADLDVYRLGLPQSYLEGYHWFSEIGGVAGPSKLRLMYAQASGPVLNNGTDIFGLNVKLYTPFAVNYQAMRPYQFLMFETYAGGNDTFNELVLLSDDHGMMSDAYCFAGRLDYAIACNLNIWGSYIWAHRLERAGFLKGGKLSNGAPATLAQHLLFVTQNFGAASGLAGGPINPYVDDGYLGWEANLGLDWKLLENMNMHVQYSYWQPGDWFTQAYQAIGMSGGVAVDNAVVDGRDAIQAIQGSFVINF
jgi:hypothetical protein